MKVIKTAKYKTAWYDDPIDPQEINSNMDEFFTTQQNNDPNAPDFAVDTRNQSIAIAQNIRRAVSKELHQIGNMYHERTPIDDVFDILKRNNLVPLQEDGTRWSGFMMSQGECGSDEANRDPIRIELAIQTSEGYVPTKNDLIMNICTMPSGKLEFVGYLS